MPDYNFMLKSEEPKEINRLCETEEKNMTIKHGDSQVNINKASDETWRITLSPVTEVSTVIVSNYMKNINRENQWKVNVYNQNEFLITLSGEDDLKIRENKVIEGKGSYKTLNYARCVAYALLYGIEERKTKKVEYYE